MMKDKLKPLFLKVSSYLFDWRGQRKINIFKTVYYNFRLFPFHIAKKLPLYIHHGVKTYKMGTICIEGEVKRRMISLGTFDLKSQGNAKILNRGKIIFRGPVILGGGIIIENTGAIVFEGETLVAEGTTLLVREKLVIGKYTRIGFRCLLTDSDYHYMVNVHTGEIKANKKEIIIGQCNWIAGCTTVKKGACTPDYTIVASNSLVSKDYRDMLPPYSIIGGTPAQLITSGYRRVFNMTQEKSLDRYFSDNKEYSFIVDLSETDIEAFCTDDPLKF
jgi:acetyltransferase-like isoleucine patch superfamily enzyme